MRAVPYPSQPVRPERGRADAGWLSLAQPEAEPYWASEACARCVGRLGGCLCAGRAGPDRLSASGPGRPAVCAVGKREGT